MKLMKPPFPAKTDTGVYYCTQAAHRKTAIDLAIAVLRELPAFDAMDGAMREWTNKSVIQGAWIRTYHQWEADTKSYFNAMHIRNGGEAPNWGKMKVPHVETVSHVSKVEHQLSSFSAKRPLSLSLVDEARCRVNDAKHEDSYQASAADYDKLVTAIDEFWQELAEQEEFTPPDRKRANLP
jgi:hypothetical protein